MLMNNNNSLKRCLTAVKIFLCNTDSQLTDSIQFDCCLLVNCIELL